MRDPTLPILLIGLFVLGTRAKQLRPAQLPPLPAPLGKPPGKLVPPAKVKPKPAPAPAKKKKAAPTQGRGRGAESAAVQQPDPRQQALFPGTAPKGAVQPGTKPAPGILEINSPRVMNDAQTDAFVEKHPELPRPESAMRSTANKIAAVLAPTKASAQAPLGTVKASPVLEPSHGSTPAGYDPAKARARARAMASYLVKKGPASYSRPELASWQRQAGLKPDGLYGGSSRGALIYFGVTNPPRPFAAPVATLPYVPPEQRK